MKLYISRHGQTPWNVEDLVCGRADVPLTEVGQQQAKLLAESALDKNIDIINEIPDIEKVEPMTHALDDFEYELREDAPEESINLDELLENCDDSTSDGEVVVPRVVG